jgi:hypothetical protein
MELQQKAAAVQTEDKEQRYLIKRQKRKRKITEEMTENVGFGLSLNIFIVWLLF